MRTVMGTVFLVAAISVTHLEATGARRRCENDAPYPSRATGAIPGAREGAAARNRRFSR
jgi:hypothetical protein